MVADLKYCILMSVFSHSSFFVFKKATLFLCVRSGSAAAVIALFIMLQWLQWFSCFLFCCILFIPTESAKCNHLGFICSASNNCLDTLSEDFSSKDHAEVLQACTWAPAASRLDSSG